MIAFSIVILAVWTFVDVWRGSLAEMASNPLTTGAEVVLAGCAWVALNTWTEKLRAKRSDAARLIQAKLQKLRLQVTDLVYTESQAAYDARLVPVPGHLADCPREIRFPRYLDLLVKEFLLELAVDLVHLNTDEAEQIAKTSQRLRSELSGLMYERLKLQLGITSSSLLGGLEEIQPKEIECLDRFNETVAKMDRQLQPAATGR